MRSLLKVKTLFEFELWTEILYFYGKQIKYFEMKEVSVTSGEVSFEFPV